MKIKILSTLVCCFVMISGLMAQTNHEEIIPTKEADNKEEQPYIKTEIMPEFIGGDEALFKYIGSQVKYPSSCKKEGITGTVYVNFVIDKKGAVKDAKVMRGIEKCPLTDDEALRVIREMPDWKPGYQSNKPVNVQFTIPIKFVLQNPK